MSLDWEPVGWVIAAVGLIGAGIIWGIGSIPDAQITKVEMGIGQRALRATLAGSDMGGQVWQGTTKT